MAINIISTDSITTLATSASKSTWVVEEGVSISVSGTGIDASSDNNFRSLEIDGAVRVDGVDAIGIKIGFDSLTGGSNTLSIGETGSVSSAEAVAISSSGGNFNFTNRGEVIGRTTGVTLAQAGNFVTNYGWISSIQGDGLVSGGSNAQIENHGTISGFTTGVEMNGDNGLLINRGIILTKSVVPTVDALGNVISNEAAVTFLAASTGNRLINSGQIRADTNGLAIVGSNGVDKITNTGEITGSVFLGLGADVFTTTGGVISGSISLGNGENVFSSTGTLITGTVIGGVNDDIYMVDSTAIALSESVDGGDDEVFASVSFVLGEEFEDLYLTGTGDLDGTANAQDNVVYGNAGKNTLWGGAGNDLISGGQGADVIIGGSGQDMADYSDSVDGVSINLAKGTGKGGEATGDKLSLIEDVTGSYLADVLVGSKGVNSIDGLNGNDKLTGSKGKDLFIFGTNYDIDTITDFKKGDRIEINAGLVDTFSEVKALMKDTGKDVSIDFGNGDKLLIKNVDIPDLGTSVFLF